MSIDYTIYSLLSSDSSYSHSVSANYPPVHLQVIIHYYHLDYFRCSYRHPKFQYCKVACQLHVLNVFDMYTLRANTLCISAGVVGSIMIISRGGCSYSLSLKQFASHKILGNSHNWRLSQREWLLEQKVFRIGFHLQDYAILL